MPSLGEQLSGQGRDDDNASIEIHAANITATTQHPEAASDDLPLFAIISGVLISFILIAVLIYAAVCSHCSSRHHRLYNVSTRGLPAHRLDTILHEDQHVSAVDYSTINNAFVDKLPQVHFHGKRDRTFSKSCSNLNHISEEAVANNRRWEKGISNAWYQATYDEEDYVMSDGPDEDEAMREGVSYRTWPLGSVEILEAIPEENEDVVTQVTLPVCSPRRQSSQEESASRRESEEESDQFYSCTEGDDLGTAEGNQTPTFACGRHTTSPVHTQDWQREQQQVVKRLLLEKISRLSSDVSRMGFSELAESEEEGGGGDAVDGPGVFERSRIQTGSARSLEALSRAWRQSPHRATM